MSAKTISVRVTTRASISEVVGETDDVLRVRIAAPPVDGAANAVLIATLARHFGVKRSSVTITTGERSKNKIVRIDEP